MMFSSRADAAQALSRALADYRGQRPLVLAIPRGAVEMAQTIAEALQGESDIVLVRKLAAPSNPEFAVGAIDETGWTWIAEYAREVGADAAYLEQESARQLKVLHTRRKLYTPERAPIDPAGRVAIIVDDGMATGATMMAALHATRAKKPARLVCAVPVASPDALKLVRPHADDVVCLHAPAYFQAVGQFYSHFPQVDDEQVIRLLSGEADDNDED